jgi:hypothetical protein
MNGKRIDRRINTRLVLALLTAVVTFTLWSPVLTVHAQGDTPVQALVLLAQENAQQLAQVQSLVLEQGGRTLHIFPHQAVIVRGPPTTLDSLAALPGVAEVLTQAAELSAVESYGPSARRLAGVWNSLLAAQTTQLDVGLMAEGHGDGNQAHADAFIAPDLPSAGRTSTSGASIAATTAITPGYYQTSEFMAGSVAVGIVLVESDGSVDPSTEDWTVDEKQLVFNEIVGALNWWAELEPRANLSFVYEDHFTDPLPTSVEPISRPYRDQKYWMADAMGALGYDAESYLARVRDYDNDLRVKYGTGWAFTIFVVDSSADSDNSFSDGLFAYAYLGGPLFVMTYDNGGYGPGNMDAVAAHEMGHIFFALDQYRTARQGCTLRSGYLDIENQNSLAGECASNVGSIMRGGLGPYWNGAIDEYGSGQIGWRDSDGDDIFDPLDTELPITITTSIDGGNVIISGTTEIVPYPSPRRTSMTINTLTGVQYRFDGGEWRQASADDGTFDGITEGFWLTDTLPSGLHVLEVAAVDSAGNVSDVYATETVAIVDPIDGGLNTEFYQQDIDGYDAPEGEMVTLSGIAYHLGEKQVTGVQYRVDNGSWQSVDAQDGAFDSDYEPFFLEIGSLKAGTHLIEARAIDRDGHVEVNFAGQQVTIVRGISSVYLPVVMGGM